MPLSYLHGHKRIEETPTTQLPPRPVYFDYTQMTDGELYLQLQKEYLRVLQQVHPYDVKNAAWKKATDMINNAIYKGLHGSNHAITGVFAPELNQVAMAINYAKGQWQPAVNHINLVKRQHVGIGADPLIQTDSPTSCDIYKSTWFDTSTHTYKPADQNKYDECATKIGADNYWKVQLNEHLEKGAHHALYEFYDDVTRTLDVAAGKILQSANDKVGWHKYVKLGLNQVTNLSTTNLQQWLRLGIARNNATKLSAGALSPEDSIQILKNNPKEGLYDTSGHPIPKIGLFGIDDALLFSLISLAVAAFKAIVSALQGSGKFQTAFQKISGVLGSDAMSAIGADWDLSGLVGAGGLIDTVLGRDGKPITTTTGSGTTPKPITVPSTASNLSKYAPYALGGAAVIYLATKK